MRFINTVAETLSALHMNPADWVRMIQADEARDKPTKLQRARVLLADTDYKIISLLKEFEPAAFPIARPDSKYLALYLDDSPLPQDITDMVIETNTPVELVAAVAQHVSRKSRAEKVDEFKALAELICERHEHTRLVAEHKMEDPETARDDEGNVITYVDWQHKNVERRAVSFATIIGDTRETPVTNPDDIDLDSVTNKFERFALGVVSISAYVGASIQYDIINQEPKGVEPQGARYEIRYPEPSVAA